LVDKIIFLKQKKKNDSNKLIKLTPRPRRDTRFDLDSNEYNIRFNLEFNNLHNLNNLNNLNNNIDDSSRIGIVEEKPKIFVIVKNDEIIYIANKEKKIKKYSKIFEIKKRSYNFYIKNTKVDCFQISIINYKSIRNRKQQITSNIKFIFIIFLYFYLWFQLFIFIQSIYMSYGDNIFKICVMPLISMIFTKLVIIENIMILLTTLVLFFKGKYYTSIRREKYTLLKKIIFNAFVPPMAFEHYEALVMYMQYTKNY